MTGYATDTLQFRQGHLGLVSCGVGTPITYLHGMLGNPGEHSFLRELAKRDWAVTAPSLPGFTGSSEATELRNLHDWVVAASEMIDVAGVTGQPVVASSVGAMVALELAAIRPEAFGPMVLIAPFGLWDPEDPVADPFATTLTNQREMLTVDPSASASFFDDAEDMPADLLVEHGVDRYLTRTASAQLVWPIPEFGISERIHLVKNEVTLIHGARDAIIPHSYLQKWAEIFPNLSGTHLVDAAGHQVEFDEPEKVASIVTSVLG
ncbi:MAG TPA: hypothetical protein DEB44_10165 [Acidimicrobiaceae bacterium]|nr:hypothetical protein [Acidimicrobiaceae bacterium]